MSLLSATTSDKTLDSFGHELEPNDRSTSHYNDLGGDLEFSCLSVTPKDTTADTFSNDIGIDSSVVHLLDSSILDLDNSAKFLKEDSLLHPNNPVTSFNREIFMILQNYKKTGDSHAAISHLHELQVESFHNELVYSIVMEAVDSELEVDETRWLKLLTSFMLAKIIPNDQLKKLLNFNKDSCRIRYCQWTLKYSIALQGRPTLYNFLRAHNILTLPCRTTIISYTGTTQGEVGLTNVNIARLKMLLNSLTQPHEGRITIEIDEMACKALLLWMQSRHKFVGEVDFGGVSMTDEDWNAIFEEENEEQSDEEDSEENVGKGIDCDGGKSQKRLRS
ncbi:hypothetical protein DAPPUDRAFT_322045 [Daphnia pulex]|uniref:MI domain-containing protein n=1 Tax=Daphnia pulex TaxID=6669 RepID=E9GUF6_DAPPU|nr:hypothetical protein DAPPUDRAFT_322045 [Daphnia pulex]|eukprot:EFX76855.1 hypothetical protein DAPPUDRAFT_322045 [Daphnia pulex]